MKPSGPDGPERGYRVLVGSLRNLCPFSGLVVC